MRGRVQRQIGRLALPDFVQSLEVVSVSPGGSPPTVSGLRALPAPAGALWPQLIFDLAYSGAWES